MSDRIKELKKKFEEEVEKGHKNDGSLKLPRAELNHGMLSAALNIIFTTLRYLAPATLITLFWGQQSFLFKILKSIDHSFRAALSYIFTKIQYIQPRTAITLFWGRRSLLFTILRIINHSYRAVINVVYSSEEQKQAVLKWVAESSSVKVEHLNTVWRHGWILCGILDAAIPGACAGHPTTRLHLKHAQDIAELYLGVEPVFTRQELETIDSLSRHQEWKLATYLERIKQALSKLTPPVSKPTSQRTSPDTGLTLDYVAQGPGITAAFVNHKSHFTIYPTSQQSLDPGEITVLIRGPKDTYGMIVLPPILGKTQLLRQKLLGLDSKSNYTENTLPITRGTVYMRNYGKTDMNKTYFIPKSKYDIEIKSDVSNDHISIYYTVNIEGKYELSITSQGQNIMGSPFTVMSTTNVRKSLEKENFHLKDGAEVDIIDVKTDRKVVLRIVDFVTEKMLLKENGALEKISDEEANVLMNTDSIESNTDIPIKKSLDKFYSIVVKIIIMYRVCKIFELNVIRKERSKEKSKIIHHQKHQQHIPDIVNSTLNENKPNTCQTSEKRNIIMIPENISLCLCEEYKKEIHKQTESKIESAVSTHDSLNQYKIKPTYNLLQEISVESDTGSIDRTSSSSNPFLNDDFDNSYNTEKALGTFVTNEFETHKSPIEETQSIGIKIMIEQDESSPVSNEKNPFIETDIIYERPKTPVLKIITGAVNDRDDSVYIDPSIERITEEILGNEFINPFFLHKHVSATEEKLCGPDFIIGAPVSLPPVMKASSPKCSLKSIAISPENHNILPIICQDVNVKQNDDISSSVFSTPLHIGKQNSKDDETMPCSSTFYSIDSNTSEQIEIIHKDNGDVEIQNNGNVISKNQIPSKKDMWDSAYVSIDETNTSPDSNNNDSKQNNDCFIPQCEEFYHMGPAEREIWEGCNEITSNLSDLQSPQMVTWESKRLFTPILEENDRCLSSDMKDSILPCIKEKEVPDPVTAAFAELNDIYHDYYLHSDNSSITSTNDNTHQMQLKQEDYTIENMHVDSASEKVSEVKRLAAKLEGSISEVQSSAAESVSVSQVLHVKENENYHTENVVLHETQFGDVNSINIVSEKKKYWNEKIKEIEEKEEIIPFKRKLSCKNLRHNDSLAKKRGQNIIKNFSTSSEKESTIKKPFESAIKENDEVLDTSPENEHSDIKLVEKWKKYWDNKLEREEEDIKSTWLRSKSPSHRASSISPNRESRSEDAAIIIAKNKNIDKSHSLPVKQELPEEVFKAFETSPKRFFGTSRKQILNKIDSFLGKASTVVISSQDEHGACQDSGLVSRRISLFHSISKTEEELKKIEEFTWKKRKSQSLHNIYQPQENVFEKPIKQTTILSLNKNHQDIKIDGPSLSEKRRLFKMSNKSLDSNTFNNKEPDSKNIQINVKKKVEDIQNQTNKIQILQKSSLSRSEMDIFNKFSKLTPIDRKTFKVSNKSLDNNEFSNEKAKANVHNISKKKKGNEIQKHAETKVVKTIQKSSMSKSETDIFNNFPKLKTTDDNLDKYKSCDELPKINVKSVISLYETVSKNSIDSASYKSNAKVRSNASSSQATPISASPISVASEAVQVGHKLISLGKSRWITNNTNDDNNDRSLDTNTSDSIDVEIISNPDSTNDKHYKKETSYLSLSDIELEIVDIPIDENDKSLNNDLAMNEAIDYKSRFRRAKEYFKSLEDLRDDIKEVKKPQKLNECEKLLRQSSESPDSPVRPPRRVKNNIKSNSLPSSEISKVWNQIQNNADQKLIKISEKFNVDDLFNDITEGRLSRKSSLRGIPHKKAVLATFKSMENLSDTKLNSYDLTVSQLAVFAKENKIRNSQTYLSEYPYLPTTNPSKYHSRLDSKACGLVSMTDLLNSKPRRNSVPDIRLNPKFTVDL